MLFSDTDRTRIAAAIAAAEAATAGEIVVIVSTHRHRYPATALAVATLASLALPLLALFAGWSPAGLFADWDAVAASTRLVRAVEAYAAMQALVFAAVLALVWFAGLDTRLTPHGLRRDRVHRAALTQFRARGLEGTAGRTGVLIFVDEPDRIAEVIADRGVFIKVGADHWHDTVRALIDGIRDGRPADGIVQAIGLAGAVLAAHVPRLPDDRNELPDTLIEI